jgi:hypothetical protein
MSREVSDYSVQVASGRVTVFYDFGVAHPRVIGGSRTAHRLTVCRICREVHRRVRRGEPGADPGRTAVRAPAVGTPARRGRPDGDRCERIGLERRAADQPLG